MQAGALAGHKAWKGITTYCVSKAALHMLCQCFNHELEGAENRVLFSCLRPGAVDTSMNFKARSASPSVFPASAMFKKRSTEGSLLKPEVSAKFIFEVLQYTSDDDYKKHEWNIMGEEHKILQVSIVMSKWFSSIICHSLLIMQTYKLFVGRIQERSDVSGIEY